MNPPVIRDYGVVATAAASRARVLFSERIWSIQDYDVIKGRGRGAGILVSGNLNSLRGDSDCEIYIILAFSNVGFSFLRALCA